MGGGGEILPLPSLRWIILRCILSTWSSESPGIVSHGSLSPRTHPCIGFPASIPPAPTSVPLGHFSSSCRQTLFSSSAFWCKSRLRQIQSKWLLFSSSYLKHIGFLPSTPSLMQTSQTLSSLCISPAHVSHILHQSEVFRGLSLSPQPHATSYFLWSP